MLYASQDHWPTLSVASLSAFLENAIARPGVRFMTMIDLARLRRTSPR
jgi:hypothetical protein